MVQGGSLTQATLMQSLKLYQLSSASGKHGAPAFVVQPQFCMQYHIPVSYIPIDCEMLIGVSYCHNA